MERYTDRNANGQAMLVLRNAVECMGENVNRWNINKRPCGTTTVMGDAVEKFAAYEEAEEKGRLFRLPCGIGDVVYEKGYMYSSSSQNHIEKIFAFRITGIQIDSQKIIFTRKRIEPAYGFGYNFSLEDIGKSIFLTQEEAEEKLKEIC